MSFLFDKFFLFIFQLLVNFDLCFSMIFKLILNKRTLRSLDKYFYGSFFIHTANNLLDLFFRLHITIDLVGIFYFRI